MVDIHVDMKMK